MTHHALRSLDLFAEALAGRPLPIEIEEDRHGWPETFALPVPDRIEVQPTGLRASVLHHWALIEFGTYGDNPAAPDPRACTHHPLVISSPTPGLAAGVLVMLEHFRADAATRRRYPGAVADLEQVLASARGRALGTGLIDQAGVVAALRLRCLGATATEAAGRCRRVPASAVAWLWWLTESLTRPSAGLDDSAAAARSIAARLVAGTLTGAAAGHRGPIGTDLVEQPPDSVPAEPGPGSAEAGDDGAPASEPGAAPVADPGPEARAVEQPGPLAAEPLPLSVEADQLESLVAARSDTRSGAAPESDTDGARIFHYDEWDYLGQRYETSWCRVLERRVHGPDDRFADRVRSQHADLAHAIRRQLARLRPEDRVRVHRVHDGDELDLDAVIESIVDRRSGAPADDRVNLRRDPARRDVATAFLIDLSASTSSPVPSPPPPDALGSPPGVLTTETDDYDDLLDAWLDMANGDAGQAAFAPKRRIIDVAKESVLLMCDAVDELGDRHAVYGFSGHGRHNVEFCVAKELDEPPSRSTAAALGALEPIRYTRMGPAIRHAAAKLAASGARTRLLIVISDGYPQDSDYGPDRGDRTYGVEDTARAIAEATGDGVDTFCLTIDPGGTDYLSVMFPHERYLIIDDVETLPAELAKLYGIAGRLSATLA